jgi:hypothetical protein
MPRRRGTAIALAALLLALLCALLAFRPRPAPVARTASRPAHLPPPRFLPAPIRIPTGEVAQDADVPAGVEGRVVSAADGSPVGGAELTFAYADSSLGALTGPDGRFSFSPTDPGTYLLARVAAPGYRAFSTEWGDSPVAFTLRRGERIRGVVLALRPARSCPGTILDGAGAPVAGAQIHVWMPPTTAAASPEDQASDGKGGFEFPAIDGILVEARLQGAVVAREEVGYRALTSCSLRLRVRDPERDPGSIEGRVEGPDGRPVGGAMIEARATEWFRETVHSLARAQTGADGRFALAPLDDTRYDVAVTVQGRPAGSAEGVAVRTRDLLFRIAAAGALRGTVRDSRTGAPVTSFSLVLTAGSQRSVFTRYDAAGGFEVSDLPAGQYRAMAVGGGYAPSEVTPVAVRPGETTTVTFQLGRGSRVFGSVIDRQSRRPIVGAAVELEGRRAGAAALAPLSAAATTGADGRFQIDGAPPGRRSLFVSAAGHHGRILGGVDAAEGRDVGPVVVDLMPLAPGQLPRVEMVGIGSSLGLASDGLVIRQVMPGTPAADGGLVAGDVILEVDGTPLRGLAIEDAIQQIRGPEGSVVVLRVRRSGGGVQEISLTRRQVGIGTSRP